MEQPIYTEEQVKAMQNVDIRTVDPAGLRDIRDVKVNTDLPKRERILDFIRQIGNPYCYRHGRDPGGPDALLHTLKMLTGNFFAKHSGH